MAVRPELTKCRYEAKLASLCKDAPVFIVAMRHGEEWPACARHVAQVMAEAFRHDGDHGHIDVYEIGIHESTLVYERAKL